MQSQFERSRPAEATPGRKATPNNAAILSQSIRKLPPFGKALADRQRFNNPPFLVVVCIGADEWIRAKQWNLQSDVCALVLESGVLPDSLRWPVKGCMCLVDWNTGPSDELIIQLVKGLIKSGSRSVVVRPLFVDHSQPIWNYDQTKPPGKRWIQTQEQIQVYFPAGSEVQNVA